MSINLKAASLQNARCSHKNVILTKTIKQEMAHSLSDQLAMIASSVEKL